MTKMQQEREARIRWLQDRLAGTALGSMARRSWEDELWRLLDLTHPSASRAA